MYHVYTCSTGTADLATIAQGFINVSRGTEGGGAILAGINLSFINVSRGGGREHFLQSLE